MAITATVLAGIALATSVAGAVSSAVMQNEAAQFEADVAEQNAKAARQAAEAEAERVARENRRKLGQARNVAAATGADSNSGSILDVLADMAGEGKLDEQIVLHGGIVQERQFKTDAKIKRFEGRSRLAGSLLKTGGTLLTEFS